MNYEKHEDGKSKRLPGLESITEPPRLIYTLRDGKNWISETIVNNLQSKYGVCGIPTCRVFESEMDMELYVRQAEVGSFSMVAIWDANLNSFAKKKRRWVHAVRGGKWEKLISLSSRAHWNVVVNQNIPLSTAEIVAHQVKILYIDQFLDRINAGLLPAGSPPRENSHRPPAKTYLMKSAKAARHERMLKERELRAQEHMEYARGRMDLNPA